MEIKKLIKKTCVSACVIFTVIVAVYMLILQIKNLTKSDAAVEASRVLLFFLFSVMLAVANSILSLPKLHSASKYTLHYLICVFGFFICFCLPTGMRLATAFVGIIFFSIGYAIVMPIIANFKRKLNKNKAPVEKYEKQFSKKKKK